MEQDLETEAPVKTTLEPRETEDIETNPGNTDYWAAKTVKKRGRQKKIDMEVIGNRRAGIKTRGSLIPSQGMNPAPRVKQQIRRRQLATGEKHSILARKVPPALTQRHFSPPPGTKLGRYQVKPAMSPLPISPSAPTAAVSTQLMATHNRTKTKRLTRRSGAMASSHQQSMLAGPANPASPSQSKHPTQGISPTKSPRLLSHPKSKYPSPKPKSIATAPPTTTKKKNSKTEFFGEKSTSYAEPRKVREGVQIDSAVTRRLFGGLLRKG